jgi:YVTN family beta-propeller protein
MRFVLSLYAVCCMLSTACIAQYLEATIRVNLRPDDVLWTPTSNKVYVSSPYDENVVVIDAATLQVRTALEMGDQPNSMCWNSVNNKLYVATCDNNRVVVVDCNGDSVITTLHVSGAPVPMAYNSTLNKLYVGATENGYVSVFDGGGDTLLRRVYVDNLGVIALLWHPGTNRVFCSTLHDSTKVIDCATDLVVSALPGASSSQGFTRNPVNDLVYATWYEAVQALTPLGDSIVTTLPCQMLGACAVPYPNKLYGRGFDTIRIVDCRTHTVTRTIRVPHEGFPMLCDTVGDRVYAASPAPQDVVFVIDPRADTVLLEVPVGRSPSAMAWDWIDNRVFVANGMDTTVSVIRTNVGIHEGPRPVATDRGQTIMVRNGVLEWRADVPGRLLDLSGRVLARLQPGSNRLPDLAPGVCFVREEAQAQAQAVTKVVLTR